MRHLIQAFRSLHGFHAALARRCLPAAVALLTSALMARSQSPITPWATNGPFASNSAPWTVYTTLVATNGTNAFFPSVCYDFTRNRILASYIASESHYSTNGIVHLVDSYDGGLTWTNDRALDLYPGHGVPHAGITALQDGSLLLEFIPRDYPNGVAGAALCYPVQVLQSFDGGDSWVTNSTIGSGEWFSASNPIFETAGGTWLLNLYKLPSSVQCSLARSTDRGLTWTLMPLDSACNESSIQAHPDGTLFLLARGAADGLHVYTSTNDGANWQYRGAAQLPNNFASYPAFCFLGNRLMIASRETPFADSVFYYSDAYPYTNVWVKLDRNGHPSLYDAPLKLSDSVALWLSAFNGSSETTPAGTNSWTEAWITANNGDGWLPTPALSDYSQPAMALYRADISVPGPILDWNDWGTLGISPTNDSDHAPVPISLGDTDRAMRCQGSTNLNFGVSNVLANFWQTNRGTIIWRSARMESGDYHWILDCFQNYGNYTGFGLRQYGGSVRFTVGNGSGSYAASYLGVGDVDYTGGFHVHAIVLHDELMGSFLDGNLAYFLPATNSTGSKAYSDSDTSTMRLTIGTFAQGQSSPAMFISDMLVFTNSLSDTEIYAWMLRIKGDPGATVGPTNQPDSNPLPVDPPSTNAPPADPTPIGTVHLGWDYPVDQLSADLVFEIRHSVDLRLPVAQWPVLTNVVGTNLSIPFPMERGQHFFVITVSNSVSGTGFAGDVSSPLFVQAALTVEQF